ncbi:hypothetical protein OH76DRAFT_868233 [Lentinus brumalis]|uniref:Uncharacterized protein n=1 Tax=Lentinus brumalis TaxID=2498619 RepID=A0A371DRC8_9APHY|nr:hypothetical protein OH76DRAFT_868233 [Polyporus brumalis]
MDVWHSPPKNLAVHMHRMTGLQAIYLCAGRHPRVASPRRPGCTAFRLGSYTDITVTQPSTAHGESTGMAGRQMHPHPDGRCASPLNSCAPPISRSDRQGHQRKTGPDPCRPAAVQHDPAARISDDGDAAEWRSACRAAGTGRQLPRTGDFTSLARLAVACESSSKTRMYAGRPPP